MPLTVEKEVGEGDEQSCCESRRKTCCKARRNLVDVRQGPEEAQIVSDVGSKCDRKSRYCQHC